MTALAKGPVRFGGLGVFVSMALIAAPAASRGQSPERDAVLGAVQELFDAMAARDTARAASVLMPQAIFFAVRPGAEPTATAAPAFLERLAGAEVPWLERLWSPTVSVHQDVAMVWAPYDFMRGDEFSHCGVDAFTLVRSDGRWRISAATYTVEPDPAACHPGRPRP